MFGSLGGPKNFAYSGERCIFTFASLESVHVKQWPYLILFNFFSHTCFAFSSFYPSISWYLSLSTPLYCIEKKLQIKPKLSKKEDSGRKIV